MLACHVIFTFAMMAPTPYRQYHTYLGNHLTKKTKFFITISGPTAVGKTSTAISVAQKYGAEIFSADSRQLFREMTIGTAKPSKEELAAVPHHFIDHVSVEEDYNAGRYERDFDKKAGAYFLNHDIGVISGGTGMYIRAAIEGLDTFPDIPSKIREDLAELYRQEGITTLQQMIRASDPSYAARVDMDNPRRLIRALEVIRVSGKPYTDYLTEQADRPPKYQSINICLTRDRDQLYERINHRVDLMMEHGLLAEVQSLMPYRHQKSLQTVGYSELFSHIDGKLSIDEAIALIKRNSRRYAKRQMTWFRNQGDWQMLDADDEDALMQYIYKSKGQNLS